MLEDFFSAEELISNIRIIQKTKMKQNEKYELVSISNHHNEQLILPVSDGSLYHLYSIIGRNLNKVFKEELDKDLLKKQKYIELVNLDDFMDTKIRNIIESNSKNTNKIKKKFIKLFSSNKAIKKEFNEFKIKNIIENLIKEEEGLMDTIFIKTYLNYYDDIVIDEDKILIDSVNEYIKIISNDTNGHYPEITDYGTAQEYFNKAFNRSSFDECVDEDPLSAIGRLYYRKKLNDELLSYVESNYFIHKVLVYSVHWALLTLIFLGIFLSNALANNVLLFMLISQSTMLFLAFCIPICKGFYIVSKLKSTFLCEYEILQSLSTKEHRLIKKQFLPY